MTASTTALHRRLERIEKQEGFHGDPRQMSDAALERLIRSSYRTLEREHGSLVAAIRFLEASSEPDDHALAVLIREDVDDGRADTWLRGRAQ